MKMIKILNVTILILICSCQSTNKGTKQSFDLPSGWKLAKEPDHKISECVREDKPLNVANGDFDGDAVDDQVAILMSHKNQRLVLWLWLSTKDLKPEQLLSLPFDKSSKLDYSLTSVLPDTYLTACAKGTDCKNLPESKRVNQVEVVFGAFVFGKCGSSEQIYIYNTIKKSFDTWSL